jgi:NAD-dependent dihydropyrimidine dehydrogenase PreA subunit
MSGTQDDVEIARELARVAIETMHAKHTLERAHKRKAMEEEYETADMLRRKALADDPLKKSQYDLELAQTLLATEKVKREAAALASKAAKAPRKAQPLAEAAVIVPPLVDKLPQPAQAALAEASVDEPPPPPLAEVPVDEPPQAPIAVDEPPQAVDEPQQPPLAESGGGEAVKKRRKPRLSYEELLEAHKLKGVVPMLTSTAVSCAADVRKAHQDYLAAKKIFDACPHGSTTWTHRERLKRNMLMADAACLAAQRRVPPILDPNCTDYCVECGRKARVCEEHRLKFDARTEDPAEFYAKAGRC